MMSNIKYVVFRVIQNAYDAIEEAMQKPTDDFYKGRKFAYYEILDTIKNELVAKEEDLQDYGLDVDLEKLFFE